jgi:hypothetical protein
MALRRTKNGIDVTDATPVELKEIGAPFLISWETADILGITPRAGAGYLYLDRAKDAASIARVQAFEFMPPEGVA